MPSAMCAEDHRARWGIQFSLFVIRNPASIHIVYSGVKAQLFRPRNADVHEGCEQSFNNFETITPHPNSSCATQMFHTTERPLLESRFRGEKLCG